MEHNLELKEAEEKIQFKEKVARETLVLKVRFEKEANATKEEAEAL